MTSNAPIPWSEGSFVFKADKIDFLISIQMAGRMSLFRPNPFNIIGIVDNAIIKMIEESKEEK